MEWIILLVVIFGLLFDYTNGFHDAANVVSTVIATRVLTPFAAIGMAGILDGARFRTFIARELDVSRQFVSSVELGRTRLSKSDGTLYGFGRIYGIGRGRLQTLRPKQGKAGRKRHRQYLAE